MANTIIQLKHSTVTGNTPASLANGEISINSRDGKLFYSTPLGVVTAFNPYPGPSGLNQEIQFNDSGVLGSDSGLTYNKTTDVLTVVGGAIVGGINVAPQIQSSYNQANAAFAAANLRATIANASIAWNTANAAFVRANNSLDANNGGTVTGTITATAFITTGAFGNITGANTIYANNFVANTGFIQFSDGSKQYTANAGSSGGGTTDQVARDTANAAFIKANTGTSGANSFGQIIANVGTILATSSNDSLQIVGESGISVSSNVSAKKIIISVPAGFTFTTADYGFVTDSTNIIYDYGTI